MTVAKALTLFACWAMVWWFQTMVDSDGSDGLMVELLWCLVCVDGGGWSYRPFEREILASFGSFRAI